MTNALNSVALAIPCRAGTLEGRLLYSEVGPGAAAAAGGAVVCAPHPFLAGNLENNVVRAVTRGLAAAGVPALAFNYRAVGGSFQPRPGLPLFEYWGALDAEGSYTEIEADLRDVLGFARGLLGAVSLVGYSFGATLALRCQEGADAGGRWCAIAPPWGPAEVARLAGARGAALIVRAEREEVATAAAAAGPVALPGVREVVLPGSDHFFRGKEAEVAHEVVGFLAGAAR